MTDAIKYSFIALLVIGFPIFYVQNEGFIKGEGEFSGRVIDVSWEGVWWKSCEIELMRGEQSSSMSYCSSTSKSYCDNIKSEMGNTMTVKYDDYSMRTTPKTKSRYLCKDYQ